MWIQSGNALVLAIIQGITEAFPISSTAHLVLFSIFTGMTEHTVQMDVALHLGTLISWMCVFHKDLWRLTEGLIKGLCGKKDSALQEVGSLIAATVPVVIVGFILNYAGIHPRGTLWIAINTLVFGLIFYGANRWGPCRKEGNVDNWRDGAKWGLFQAMALFPGVSRLGICITGGRLLGYCPQAAVRFSFLMGIPSMAGALVLKAPEIATLFQGSDKGLFLKVVALSCAVNIPCVKVFQMWVAKYSMSIFAGYRILLGIWLLGFAMR